ncbi:MoaF C-terminal domain-containing protein [Duganella radicis]|uniref:Molybdenum cofactor biosynthesis protein F n=1 Tax=Duganella radicis TaxID=551988 RepID=A0A6L6PAV7_9BURK|nr:MoaF C-terminal domain-containing protein [Duganella radicis]MTV36030.1 molybdenum cofactor biosynthesis protein F [Duganella radicis]
MTQAQEWITVGALGDAFAPDNHCLTQSRDLAGRTLQLHYEDGGTALLAIDQLAQCSVTAPRPGIYFVDYLPQDAARAGVSLVINLEAGSFIELTGTLPTREEAHTPLLQRASQGKELTAVRLRTRRGTVGRPFADDAALPQPTTAMLGKRVEYIYSPHERYEHIYLNQRFYTWRCIDGAEKGLAETDACDYYAIAPDLYLFIWREKIIPTLGVIMVDLRAMKTTGKIMGYDGDDFDQVRNFGVGAHARVLATIPWE